MTDEATPRLVDHTVPAGPPAGWAIVLGSVLSVAFMSQHPILHARGLADFVTQMSQGAVINGIVHGALMALAGVLFVGYSGLAARLGMQSLIVRAGLTAYALGAIALVAAALVNGFVVPDYVARYAGRTEEELQTLPHVLALARSINQVSSRLAVLALSAAILLWSVALLRQGRLRTSAVFGCVVGLAPPLALFLGYLPMNVHGFGAFVIAQMLWSLAIAVPLIRGRI